MKKIISGIQPSGTLHIGNYFGAIQQFIKFQEENDCLFFVADYHALTSSTDAAALRKNTRDVVLDYLALGVDPKKASIFIQSHVPTHTELMWILSNLTPMGLLERGHSFKDKSARGISSNTGLFTYPVLMAADILMYDVDMVPVGKDQKQHLEMTRDIAIKFNEKYTPIFKLPESMIVETTAVVPGVDGAKMSKSYGNTIDMFASKKVLKKQIMSIVTDSTPLEDPKNPENNITTLYKLFTTPKRLEEMKDKFRAGNYGYGHAKKELLEVVLEYFAEARAKREELIANPEYVDNILAEGAKKAQKIADAKIIAVKKAVGLI